jgi:hypothetical protein
MVMVLPTGLNPTAATVAVVGMPAPEIGSPIAMPLRLDTAVITGLPLVTLPVGVTELVADADNDVAPTAWKVTVLALGLNAEMVESVGRLVPLRNCPVANPLVATSPAVEDTPVSTLLLLVVKARNPRVRVMPLAVVVIWVATEAANTGSVPVAVTVSPVAVTVGAEV